MTSGASSNGCTTGRSSSTTFRSSAARLLAIVAVVLLCFLAGLFARTAVAQQFVGLLESAILSNLLGYSLVSSLGADVAGTGHGQSHMQVMLARIEDCWQVGLLVERIDESNSAIFVPGASDPKSGSIYLMTDHRFKAIDLRIPQAMKRIKGPGVGSRELFAGRL